MQAELFLDAWVVYLQINETNGLEQRQNLTMEHGRVVGGRGGEEQQL